LRTCWKKSSAIEDEFDSQEDRGEIFALADGTWRVAGDTPIERVSEAFEVDLRAAPESDLDVEFDTIGGLIAHQMGRVPRRGEQLRIAGLNFAVLHARGGAVRWFKVARAKEG